MSVFVLNAFFSTSFKCLKRDSQKAVHVQPCHQCHHAVPDSCVRLFFWLHRGTAIRCSNLYLCHSCGSTPPCGCCSMTIPTHTISEQCSLSGSGVHTETSLAFSPYRYLSTILLSHTNLCYTLLHNIHESSLWFSFPPAWQLQIRYLGIIGPSHQS